MTKTKTNKKKRLTSKNIRREVEGRKISEQDWSRAKICTAKGWIALQLAPARAEDTNFSTASLRK